MKSIGVLMSVYVRDDPQLLKRALNSIFSQELPQGYALRLFLGVDGPIGPGLTEIIEKHRSQIFLLYTSPVNVGLAAVLNQLVSRRSDEEFYFRMDADDVSLPGRFMAQILHMEKHKDIDILGTDIVEVDVAAGTERVVSFCRGPENARRFIAKRVPVAHPTVCFRAHVFNKVPGYPTVHANEDIAMWFACMRAGFKFDNVPEVFLAFTISPNFWKRRSYEKAFYEFLCYMTGIRTLYGITWRYVYPLARLGVRLSPTFISKWMYGNGMRRLLS